MAIEVNWQREPETRIETAEEVDTLLDQLKALSTDSHQPIIAMIGRADEDFGPSLQIGVNGERGFVTYGSGIPGQGGTSSAGDGPDRPIAYYFQGTPTEFSERIEIPFGIVKQAVREFLATNGERPTSPPWAATS